MIYYKQCTLERQLPNGIAHTTSWIPEKFAIVGEYLQLKSGDDWINGWLVTSASERKEGKLVEDQAHNAKDIWAATSGPSPRGNK